MTMWEKDVHPEDITIYIPTMGRVGNQLTWDTLPDELKDQTITVCPPEEAEELELLGHNVAVFDEFGYAAKMRWIIEQHDVDALGPSVLILDDDLDFFERRKDDPGKFSQRKFQTDAETDRIVRAAFKDLSAAMSLSPMAGFRSRQLGNTRPEGRFLRGTRQWAAAAIDVNFIRENDIRWDRLEVLGDMDALLTVLSLGVENVITNRYVIATPNGSDAPGGCSTYRTAELQAECAEKLALLWPDVVKVVQKNAKSGGDRWRTRTDVRIQWKKALALGKEGKLPRQDIDVVNDIWALQHEAEHKMSQADYFAEHNATRSWNPEQ